MANYHMRHIMDDVEQRNITPSYFYQNYVSAQKRRDIVEMDLHRWAITSASPRITHRLTAWLKDFPKISISKHGLRLYRQFNYFIKHDNNSVSACECDASGLTSRSAFRMLRERFASEGLIITMATTKSGRTFIP